MVIPPIRYVPYEHFKVHFLKEIHAAGWLLNQQTNQTICKIF